MSDKGKQSGYDRHRERAGKRERKKSRSGRDIAPLPEVENLKRKREGRHDCRHFLEAYFPSTFYLPWSDDHLKVIERVEDAVLRGGLFALAMPRGSGKTSLCERACIWAILYGHRRFVCLLGSDEGHAQDMLETIKTELESNERLLADFPEVAHPIHSLEGIANRCKGQLYEDERTRIEWTSKKIVLPSLQPQEPEWEEDEHREFLREDGYSLAAGAVLTVSGITGRIRGMKHQTADGEPIRPDLVILDDPQTDESARSRSQCQTRESILAGAVLGLAGPGKKISGIMPCTVIQPGDMADRILDQDKHPRWQGERMQMVYSFPDNEELWDEYGDILAEDLRSGGDGSEATEFYREHREEMDEGAEVAWPERHNEDEISGLQHAMNLKLRDEATFWAEYQNEPQFDEGEETDVLEAEAIAAKTNGRKRRKIPAAASILTAAVDVQKKLLYYVVCAWEGDFTGYVVDYGTYPEQHRSHFTLRDVNRTLRRVHQGMGYDGAIYAGLEELTGELLGGEWPCDDGSVMRVGRCMVDQGWKTDVIHQFCRQSEHAAILTPARGQGISASQKPISEYNRSKGDRIGFHWWMPKSKGKRALRHVEVDTNYWKTFVHERLGTAMGDNGCLSVFGEKASQHRMFSEHLAAEYAIRTEGRGRTVNEWHLPPNKPDNHFFDCMVNCAAAASMEGAERVGVESVKAEPDKDKKPINLNEVQVREM